LEGEAYFFSNFFFHGRKWGWPGFGGPFLLTAPKFNLKQLLLVKEEGLEVGIGFP